MSDKLVNDIIETVRQNEVYVKAVSTITDDEKKSVDATLEEFVKLMGPMLSALEQLESSEDVAEAVRQRLAEKLSDG